MKIETLKVYNTVLFKQKSKDNLIGRSVDWIWINEVWGGVKIGRNSRIMGADDTNSFDPIYLVLIKKTR